MNKYIIGKWHGQDNYGCPACPLTTLDLAVLERHLNRNPDHAEVDIPEAGTVTSDPEPQPESDTEE